MFIIILEMVLFVGCVIQIGFCLCFVLIILIILIVLELFWDLVVLRKFILFKGESEVDNVDRY